MAGKYFIARNDVISKNVFGRKLPKSRKKLAGEAVHYAMGTTLAAAYGALGEVSPVTTIGGGLAFDTAVWMFADEVSVPALGWSKPPTKTPSPSTSTRWFRTSSTVG